MPADTKNISLTGLHLLLTYECNFQCDHCFVWGGPDQGGTMTRETIQRILDEAEDLGTIEWIYFEGGEPFLCYDLMCWGARRAKARGFRVGLVTNAYWASSAKEARERLRPLAGVVEDLSISDDGYHSDDEGSKAAKIARRAAGDLQIPVGFISVAEPEATEAEGHSGQLPAGKSAVLFRGRAAEKLAPRVPPKPWKNFTKCPWEDLQRPDRVHVDAYGNLHVCQGISIGNLFDRPLRDIMRSYDAEAHPIVGPLISGGPAALVQRYGLAHRSGYADACHLCYRARCDLRDRFPDALAPDRMYGDS
jgi:MoaA/NifB/PqqE/SkfB family radical SAM enzyme